MNGVDGDFCKMWWVSKSIAQQETFGTFLPSIIIRANFSNNVICTNAMESKIRFQIILSKPRRLQTTIV